MKVETLSDYIKRVHGTQQAFADVEGVLKQAVTRMLSSGYIVVDGAIWSKRRNLTDFSTLRF